VGVEEGEEERMVVEERVDRIVFSNHRLEK